MPHRIRGTVGLRAKRRVARGMIVTLDVITGPSRSKNGVASARLCPGDPDQAGTVRP